MVTKIENIIEELKSLTLLEASELVKQIESTFDVDASTALTASPMIASVNTVQASSDIEEKTEFDVILEDVPAPKKIAILKAVRSLMGLGLKDAKDFVESVPKVVKESTSKEDAEEIKIKLEEAGATVSLK